MNSRFLKQLILILSIEILLCLIGKSAEIPIPTKFLNALKQVESGGNPKAIGDNKKAIGIYQIHKSYFLDAQQFNPELRQNKWEDCFNVEVSNKVIQSYLNGYGRNLIENKDFEGLARLHNSGPQWEKKKQLTNSYWARVNKYNLTF